MLIDVDRSEKECRRCQTGASYRRDVSELFTKNPTTLYNRKSIFRHLVDTGVCCYKCATPTHIGSLLYHLRQDGTVERVGRGQFRFRASDQGSPDFVYAKRKRIGP